MARRPARCYRYCKNKVRFAEEMEMEMEKEKESRRPTER